MPLRIAKLNDGRIVRVVRDTVPVPFDQRRNDWVLVTYPVERSSFGHGCNKTNMFWTVTTKVVWRIDMAD